MSLSDAARPPTTPVSALWRQRTTICVALFLSTTAVYGQTLSISPSQAYVSECQETFVVLTGTNLTGTASTLVDFSGNSQLYELAPNAATPTRLDVWIPMGVALATGTYSVSVLATDTGNGTRTIGPVTFSVVARSGGSPPLVALPEVVVADAGSSSGTYVTFNAGTASCDHASGSFFSVGTTTVTCTSTNGFGTTTATFSVVVTSTSAGPPILTLPEVVIAEAASSAGANVSFNSGGATCDHTSGAVFPMGNTSVTCSSTNSFGTSSGSFLVVVTDTTRPVLNLPADFTTTTNIVTYSATASDAIDGALTPACSPSSGSNFPNGLTVVQCSATDAHVNTASGTFRVTVTPLTLADFTASQNVYQLNGAASESVTYTSNVPVTLTETLTIKSDATGATVRTLFNGSRSSGTYQDVWNGTNDAGQLVADGAYRYFVTVSAGGSTVTWDDGSHYAGSTETQLPYVQCRNDASALVTCNDASITFDPYANRPLRLDYCAGGGTPPGCSGTTPCLVVAKALSTTETDDVCRSSDCLFTGYQSSGAHELTWYGTSVGGLFIGNATGATVIRRNDIWPRNLTLVYGTAPVLSNFTVSSPIFNPASTSGETFTMTVATFQSRAVTIQGQFRNLTSGSVLRTVTTAAQPAGQVVLTWNGRADNGAWVAPGSYEVTVTVTDSAGSSTVLKPLIAVRYE
jgi:flagellar hook assembly protein FlgD